jgi:hypothetical protein
MIFSPLPSEIDSFLLANRIALDPKSNQWTVLCADSAQLEFIISDFVDELQLALECFVAIKNVNTMPELIELSKNSSDQTIVFKMSENLGENDWKQLDACRTKLMRTTPGVLAIKESKLLDLISYAPHFASWVGCQIWKVRAVSELSESDRESRLISLRQHFSLSDEDLITKINSDELLIDPDIAEWLVLLGRGDLIGER